MANLKHKFYSINQVFRGNRAYVRSTNLRHCLFSRVENEPLLMTRNPSTFEFEFQNGGDNSAQQLRR